MRTRLVALPLLHYSQESMEHYQTASSFMIPTGIKKYKTRAATTKTIFSNTSKKILEANKKSHPFLRKGCEYCRNWATPTNSPTNSICWGGSPPLKWPIFKGSWGEPPLQKLFSEVNPHSVENSFNSNNAAKHFKRTWNFYYKHMMTHKTSKKYEKYNSTYI